MVPTRDNPAPAFPALLDRQHTPLAGYVQKLSMHLVFLNILGPYRLKGSCTDVKRHLRFPDALRRDVSQHLRVKVQARRGGAATAPSCCAIYRLVTALVGCCIGPVYIGWQRHVTKPGRNFAHPRFRKANPIKSTLLAQHRDAGAALKAYR